MTGVVAGSGGTGVLEGSRPGTGVEGGGGSILPSNLGAFAEPSGYSATWDTPPITAEAMDAMYLVFVQSTCGIDQPANVYTCSGMGLEWVRLVYDYYDSSTSGSDRSAQALFYARGLASDGPLTFTKDLYAKLAVSVVGVEGGQVATSGWTSASAAGTADLEVGPLADPLPATVLIAGNQRFDDSQREPVLEDDWVELGWSGWATFNAACKTAFINNVVDSTFNIATDAGNQGGIVFGVAVGVPSYAGKLNSLGDLTARYPFVEKGTQPNIDGYVTEISKAEYDLTARYPLAEKGTQPGGILPYDTLLDTLDPGFLIQPGPLGAGTDPGTYDTLLDTLDPSFLIQPGPLGAGTDPVGYTALLEDSLNPTRFYPLSTVGTPTPFPNYTALLEDTLNPTRFYPLSALTPPTPTGLAGAILELSPASFWKMDDASSPAVDTGSLGNDAAAVGGVTWADVEGPDGESYPSFNGSTGRLDAGDADEYSINTVGGTTFSICFRPTAWTGSDGTLLLGKFKVSDNEWIIRFDSTDGTDLLAQVYNTGQAFAFLGSEMTAPAVSLDEWNTLVVVFPAEDTAPVLYLNSSDAATVVDVGVGGTREPDNTGPLTIGGSASSAGFLTGAAANVAVFDYELSAVQVASIMDPAIEIGWAPVPPVLVAGTPELFNDEDFPRVIPLPADVQVGDTLILIFGDALTNGAVSVSAGWSVHQNYVPAVGAGIRVWTRTADGTAADTPTLTPGKGYGVASVLRTNLNLDPTLHNFFDAAAGPGSIPSPSVTAVGKSIGIGIGLRGNSPAFPWTVGGPAEVLVNGNAAGGGNLVIAALAGADGDEVGDQDFVSPAAATAAATSTLLLGVPVGGLGSAIDSLSPLSHVVFDDASGNFADTGSRGGAATAAGTVFYQDVAGPDGVDYVRLNNGWAVLADAPDLGIDSAVGKTFAIAFRSTSFATYSGLIGKLTSGAPRDYGVFTGDGDGLFAAYRYQDNTSNAYSGYRLPSAPTINEWHFLIARANTDGTTDMWIDSETAAATVTVLAPTGTPEQDGTAQLSIGSLRPDFAQYDFAGAVAHFAIFDDELTDPQVAALMQSAIAEGWTA